MPVGSVTPGVDCNKAEPPQKERSACLDAAVGAECPEAFPAAGQGFDELESDSPSIQCAGADCGSAEPPQKSSDFVKSVVKDEAGVMSLGCVFDGLPNPVECLRGDTQGKLSTGRYSVLSSDPQLVVSGVSGVAAEGGGQLLTLLARREFPPLWGVPEAGSRLLPCQD